MTEPVGVYLSVPFCKAKCTFCNFASGVFGAERMQQYVDRLCEEIRGSHAAARNLKAALPRSVDTVYFGGGTPSLLSAPQLRQIFEHLRREFDIADGAEITLECAPGQLSGETLDELLGQGMNRISFGVQSFIDRESAAVGRLHTEAECDAEIARVRAAGVSEINLDLIAGLPHQTEQSWRYSVERAIAGGVPHVSVYLLEVDDESRLGREILEHGGRYGASDVPSEDEAAEWYLEACEALNAAGVDQYEISNFARRGHRSRHNLKYWLREPYVGFGLDAHSMLPLNTGAMRFANTRELDEYLAKVPHESTSPFPLSDSSPAPEFVGRSSKAFEETLFLGLRLNDGVELDSLRDEFGEESIGAAMHAAR